MTLSGTYDEREEMEYEIIISALLDKLKRVPNKTDLKRVNLVKPVNIRKRYIYFGSEKIGTINLLNGEQGLIMTFKK